MEDFTDTTRMRRMTHDTKAVKAGDRQHGGPLRQTDAQIRAQIRKEEGAAVARGNRTPYEPVPPESARPSQRTNPKRFKSGGLAVMPKGGKKC